MKRSIYFGKSGKYNNIQCIILGRIDCLGPKHRKQKFMEEVKENAKEISAIMIAIIEKCKLFILTYNLLQFIKVWKFGYLSLPSGGID